MSRLTAIKRLLIASFAASGLVIACRAATPGEAPPLAPRPEIGQPTNSVPRPPDPLDPPDPGTPEPSAPREDAGPGPISPFPTGPVTTRVELKSSVSTMQAPRDGGVDAARPDAPGTDAATGVDAAPVDATRVDAAPVAPRDGRVPDAGDSGVTGLPPVSDATIPIPGDAARPLR